MAPRWQRLSATLLAVALLASASLLAAAPAPAAVGVEKASRTAGLPGAAVDLTLACGFCFPPCHGAPGHRNTPCMLGTKAQPPESFPVSLVPIEKAPKPHRCGPNALCSPQPSHVPGQPPFTFLGDATPPAEDDGSNIPRYLLDFSIPMLPPGVYTYVIFCDVCARGKSGSLIANPRARSWRLRIRGSG
jgi:hypothetical protein